MQIFKKEKISASEKCTCEQQTPLLECSHMHTWKYSCTQKKHCLSCALVIRCASSEVRIAVRRQALAPELKLSLWERSREARIFSIAGSRKQVSVRGEWIGSPNWEQRVCVRNSLIQGLNDSNGICLSPHPPDVLLSPVITGHRLSPMTASPHSQSAAKFLALDPLEKRKAYLSQQFKQTKVLHLGLISLS